ncbi:MAG: hypothetical protein BGO34_17990 [Bacteroidia bacterium 44-10]|nr:MAG: hypothetical protein BGO34_17990 [Bacteroidia bacterium 44-10]OJW03258.1 MAG: hypothetical protein BGO49_11045 [Planctomycetales bacterium 71-10]
MSGKSKPGPPQGFIGTALTDLEVAWRERIEEAEVLETAGFHSTAAALRLYALEILVKVVICKHLGLSLLPVVCKKHELVNLIIHTGLWKELQVDPPTRLLANWDILANYSESRLNDLRYEPREKLTEADATRIKEALHGSEQHPDDGVVAWLSKHI